MQWQIKSETNKTRLPYQLVAKSTAFPIGISDVDSASLQSNDSKSWINFGAVYFWLQTGIHEADDFRFYIIKLLIP